MNIIIYTIIIKFYIVSILNTLIISKYERKNILQFSSQLDCFLFQQYNSFKGFWIVILYPKLRFFVFTVRITYYNKKFKHTCYDKLTACSSTNLEGISNLIRYKKNVRRNHKYFFFSNLYMESSCITAMAGQTTLSCCANFFLQKKIILTRPNCPLWDYNSVMKK